MFLLVLGGAASGKSAYAEEWLVKKSGTEKLFYLAAMSAKDKESLERIKRHRRMRKEKGFLTIERYLDYSSFCFPQTGEKPSALLECVSNLLANEMFSGKKSGQEAAAAVLEGVARLLKLTENLAVVSNVVSFDGVRYSGQTKEYIDALSQINARLLCMADCAVEVVYTTALEIKEKGERNA